MIIITNRRAMCLIVVTGLVLASCTNDGDTTAPDTVAPVVTEAPVESGAPALIGEGLHLGLLDPGPGPSATLFQGQVRGVDLAALDIADGGGVLEGPLTATTTETPLGSSEADVVVTALDGGAEVLVGPTLSTGATQVRSEVQEAGAIACSAAASTPGLTADQDQFGLFRTALADDAVVAYLANRIVERHDALAPGVPWKVAIVARSDAYGLSVGNGLAVSLEARDLDAEVIGYNPFRVQFVGLGSEVTSMQPDLTVIVSYEEGASIVTELVRSGVEPSTMIGLDAFFRPRIATLAAPDGDVDAVDGFTMIGTTGNLAFMQRLFDDDSNGQIASAAQAYDCAVILALGTEAVAVGSSATISAAVREVTADGTTCTTYADCLEKLRAGEDIDYDGATGNLAIDEAGDTTFARFTSATLLGGELTNIETDDIAIVEIPCRRVAFAAAAFTTELEEALLFLAFYGGPIDGLDSAELSAALMAFQTSVGLAPTGVYDAETAAALRAALGEYADLLNPSTSDLQFLLTEFGYYSGPIDGIWYGEVTVAVNAYQGALGVPEAGTLDAATVRAACVLALVDGSEVPPPTAPTTTVPATTAPPTTAPAATAPPTTVPATTAPPTTVPAATAPPTTVPAATAPPTTVPATTVPPPAEPPTQRLLGTLQADPDFDNFVELVLLSGFGTEMDAAKLYTVFAPTDDVFTEEVLNELRNDPARVRAALGYYVVEGNLLEAQLTPGMLQTISGALLEVVGAGDALRIQGAAISKPDILASNGVIHGIASFLIPPG